MMFDQCFELTGKLTETEKSLLYYIAGYVAKKEDLCTEDDDESKSKMMTNRRKNLIPSSQLWYCEENYCIQTV